MKHKKSGSDYERTSFLSSEQVERQKQLIEEKRLKQLAEKEEQKRRSSAGSNGSRRSKVLRSKVPATQSNKTLIKNALKHVSLAGAVNESVKKEVLQVY